MLTEWPCRELRQAESINRTTRHFDTLIWQPSEGEKGGRWLYGKEGD